MICPCVVIQLDKSNYEDLEMDAYKTSDEICEAIMQKRPEYKCIQEVYYRLKELENYRTLSPNKLEFRSGSLVAFKAFLRNMHPVNSLF